MTSPTGALYTREFFEPLTPTRWSEARAREGIRVTVSDVAGALRGPKLLWRAHEWDSWHATSPMKNLYVGAAGVLWGLDVLRRRGHGETRLDLAALGLRALELFRERPDFIKSERPSPVPLSGLFLGETGILLVAHRLAPSAQLEEALLERVRANLTNDVDELFWGIPGTLHAAAAMFETTGHEQWRRAWLESADALWSRRTDEGLWVQRLYGNEVQGLSASHGLVGNALSLLRGGKLLARERRLLLEHDTNAILARTALVEGKRANWPHRARPPLYPDGQIRLQWCSGGPGIVVSTADFLDDDLLLMAAELIWDAGPHSLEKAGCICHGTAGNGYALLKAFARTGDELWLGRARRFAMHALEQVERLRAQRGTGRYSLWTGDVGVALFAADCIDSRTSYPVLDSFDW